MSDDSTKALNIVMQIYDQRIQNHLGKIVWYSVDETLNSLLDAEAGRLAGADKYERRDGRKDYRSGYCEHKLHTKAGEVKLKVSKHRHQTFETAIIERYRRRERSVEEDASGWCFRMPGGKHH